MRTCRENAPRVRYYFLNRVAYIMKDGRRITLTSLSTTGYVGTPIGTLISSTYAAVAEFRS